MTTLPIIWQRLVSAEGKTCDRCDATFQAVKRAVGKLNESLRPLGIEPVLEIKEIDQKSFDSNPSESNRIWIGDRAIEDWLGATVGSSPCCSVCGNLECRTIELNGGKFEVVTEQLLLKAALLAASQLLGVDRTGATP